MPRPSPWLLCTYYKHFPKSYIDKVKKITPKKVFGNRFGAPDIVEYDRKPEDYVHDEHRPWEQMAQNLQDQYDAYRKLKQRKKVPKVDVTPIADDQWLLFRGDRVQILVGRDKGRQGIVNYIVRERNWCFVEGLNCVYEMVGGVQSKNFKGVMAKREKPLDVVTEVSLVDPVDFLPTQVEWRWNELGERVRQSMRTGHLIPMPVRSQETFEYATPETYQENEKDTSASLVRSHTFEPKLASFEEEVMKLNNIDVKLERDDTYWY